MGIREAALGGNGGGELSSASSGMQYSRAFKRDHSHPWQSHARPCSEEEEAAASQSCKNKREADRLKSTICYLSPLSSDQFSVCEFPMGGGSGAEVGQKIEVLIASSRSTPLRQGTSHPAGVGDRGPPFNILLCNCGGN